MDTSSSQPPRSDASVVPFPYGTETGNGLTDYGLRLQSNESEQFPPEGLPVLSTRGASAKGPKGPLVCQVEGCQKDLLLEKKYYKRYRICMEHLKKSAICVDGEMQRFCQQCGRFHGLDKFDGDKRNCRERLSQHNRRRRKSKRETAESGDESWDDTSMKRTNSRASKSRRKKSSALQTERELWSGNYGEGGHAMTSEEQNVLGSVGMDMMQGIPVGVTGSAALGYGDAESQSAALEGESFYNMIVHHVLPQTDVPNSSECQQPPAEAIATRMIAGNTNGVDSIQNLSNLLQIPEDISKVAATEGLISVPAGMLKPMTGPTSGAMPTVPMLVFPSTSSPHQLNAVAIIPSASSSCSTIVPLPWQGGSKGATSGTEGIPLPIPEKMPAVEAQGEIPSLVSFALSASGISQGSSSYQPAISPNQLAHFQMLMARQISCQLPESSAARTQADEQRDEKKTEETQDPLKQERSVDSSTRDG